MLAEVSEDQITLWLRSITTFRAPVFHYLVIESGLTVHS